MVLPIIFILFKFIALNLIGDAYPGKIVIIHLSKKNKVRDHFWQK